MMKYLLSILTFILLFISKITFAENIVQLKGGNYVFVENGKLTFNLEPSLFKNRNWRYNAETDSVETLFTTKQFSFKTKHSSTFYAYETVFNRAYPYSHYASNGYLVRPIYNPKYSGFGQQRVVLPAIGGLIRIGASVARQVLPPFIANSAKWCVKNTICKVATGVVGAHLCLINMGLGDYKFELPFGICQKAEEAGFKKDENGVYKRSGNYRVDAIAGIAIFGFQTQYFSDKQSALNEAERLCKSHTKFNNRKLEFKSMEIRGDDFLCRYDDDNNLNNGYYEAIYAVRSNGQQEIKLQMVDLEQFAKEDFKENPNAYMNDKGELGKELRAAIRPEQAYFDSTMGSGGTFSVISSPYRDSNGETKQDVVHIGGSQKEPNPVLGGNASNPTAGVSNIYNNVVVNNLSRPDLESESQAGENNHAHGTNGNAGMGTDGSNGSNGEKQGEGKNYCEENSETAGCARLGDVNDDGNNPFSDGIGKSENKTQFEPDYFLPNNGTCPSPKQFSLMGKNYEFSYNLFCEYSQNIRAIVIAVAFMVAGFVIFGRKVA